MFDVGCWMFFSPPSPLPFSFSRATVRLLLRPTFTVAVQRGSSRAKKSGFRRFRLCLLLGLLAIVSLGEPRIFRWAVRQAIIVEAWRTGGRVRIGSVEGSLFEPIRLIDAVWTRRSESGAVTRVEIKRLSADFAWENLFTPADDCWFRRLSLDGLSAKIEVPATAKAQHRDSRLPLINLNALKSGWLPAPAIVEGRDVDLIIASSGDFVRLQDARFRVSELESGTLKIGRLTVKQPWLDRSFSQVRGTTAMQESRLLLARLRLAPDMEIKSYSADLRELARGRLKQEIHLEAFGGNIKAEAEMRPDEHTVQFEAGGTFSQIEIGQAAAFLGLSEAAGGTIKEGNFAFRGSPKNVEKATSRVYVEATNFQWESRQWNSLVLGAELVERRLRIHDLVLDQGHNRLTLKGEITLPQPEQHWWQSDFNCTLAARIDNLTELSALLLPEFTYAAGRVTIEGVVHGHAEKFNGHLVLDGSKLVWRDAPIEELHATLRLKDNDLQVANFNIFNGEDYVRGQGVVNILGPTQYWGMLRASVDDLGRYAAILQRPIVPEPLAGGALIDWDGEGSAKGHSGRFVARLQKLRSLGASAALLHPINAQLEGSYAAGGMVFSKFVLSDDESSFTANVAVGNKALALQGIRLMHKQQLWLEGDALLPLDVWRAWPDTSLDTLLDDKVPSKVTLTAYNLELGAAAKLSGWNFPIEGVVSGDLSVQGPLTELQTSGKLALEKARLPLGTTDLALTDVTGTATFAGQNVQIANLSGGHPTGDFRAHGTVGLKNVRDPELHLEVESERTTLPVFTRAEGVSAELTAAMKMKIDGPASGAQISGAVLPLEMDTRGKSVLLREGDSDNSSGGSAIEVTSLWSEAGTGIPPILSWPHTPWSKWRFDVIARGGPLPRPSPVAAVDLHLTGTGGNPMLDGSAAFKEAILTVNGVVLREASGALTWRDNAPSIDLRATGELHGFDFVANLLGPVASPIRYLEVPPPLSEGLVTEALAGRYESRARLDDAPRFALRVAAVVAAEVEIFTWNIADPSPSTSLPGVSASHAPHTDPPRNFQ